MLTLRPSSERGYADHGWLQSHHSFSFADYHDPAHMGWGNLRVINEDFIAAGKGFGTHGHTDMEIITYVISGSLAHQDSMGNARAIPPGDVQRMSAGTGVRHSEFNHAEGQTTHLLQIWILPNQRGVTPSYEQTTFSDAQKRGQLCLVASGGGESGAVFVHADAKMYAGLFDGAETATVHMASARKAYVQVVRGSVSVNGAPLQAGDAAQLDGESSLTISNGKDAEVLVFDLTA